MPIKIQDEDPFTLIDQMFTGDGNIVEDAKSAPPGNKGMMPGGSYQGKTIGFCCQDGSAHRGFGCCERAFRAGSIQIKVPPRLAEIFYPLDITG